MNDLAQAELSNRSTGYWAARLKGAPALLELPADRPRPAAGARRRAELQVELPQALAERTRVLAAELEVPRELLLGTAWAALLGRLSSQQEVVLGLTGVAGGDATVPLRFDLAGDPDLHALLSQAREQLTDAARHRQELFALLDALGADRLASHHPLFQAAFRASGQAGPEAGPLLDIELILDGPGAGARLAYAAELFDAGTVERWWRHYRCLLTSLLHEPGKRFSDLDLLDERERKLLLEEVNATAVPFPVGTLLHQLFESQVDATPDAVALVSDGARLSYRQLNERANRLAHALVALGVKPDDRVGLCCERGAELIVGMLGILKAGGAYVPLDPAYPADRLAYMVQDSRPVAVLTQAALREVVEGWLDPSAPAPVILLDGAQDDPRLAGQPVANPDPATLQLTPAHLAYVIYTSGSTGKPKGVMNQHDGVVNSVRWAQSEFRLTPADRLLQKTSYSFDVSVWEVFVPLMSGAVLVMARPGGHRDPDYVADVIQREGVTVVQFVPSMLQIFLDHADLSRCAGLRLVISGGEALPAALQQRFHVLLPGIRLHNVYGPTEAAVYVTHWPCSPEDSFVPIGVPLANTSIYILDPKLQPVPLGVVGELFIGGVQVARGYLNRPELSAERFIPDPFSTRPGATLYRTGDLARRRSDGRLEFLGRNDFQVKVQGHRIELGDIESRLQAFPGVREAVVLARADDSGEARLVAYFTQGAGTDVTIRQLRQHLLEGLPAYMVPAHFVAMESFPSTANGKLDRNALPEPEAGREGLAVAFEPPVGHREQRICAEFSAALGVAEVGRHDNFFDLGGNSLLAMRLLARLQKLEGRSLPAPMIFGSPTPAGLARAIEGGEAEVLEISRLPNAHRSVAMAAERLAGAPRGSVNEPIAIIGMAGRFPGANDVETFWRNLREGLDTITRFAPEDLDPWVPEADRENPNYVRARGILDGYDLFDAGFFGISAREAELMDPQQRIFLELCWECMERAGHVPDAAEVPVGVFAGTWDSTYYRRHVCAHPDLIARLGEMNVMIGNEKDYIATRVAHKLNLTGPAIGVYTACSTGLVAVCQAMDSLRLGHCDMALAGGISIACPPNTGYEYLEGAMFSPDGHTRTFDANAQGTVFNDGAAVVLLKRLSDAIADGDHVHAVVLGGAVNNDGGAKSSFTAPSAEGQAALVAMAQANAGVSPRSISYVEAHGTGTPIGDPIEIAGLTKAFRRFTGDTGFCRIGSVKSNVGHLITAAGSAGLIKTALALENRCLPPSVNFESNNPAIDFAGSPFVVNDRLIPWEADGAPLRAGVSSFGVGGTNAHVVVEQAPELPASDPAAGPQLLVLSARTPAALANAAANLAGFLQAHEDAQTGEAAQTPLNLADVAWTLAAGRKAFPHRIALAAVDAADAIEQLRSPLLAAGIRRSTPARACDPVFAFPGQGSQYPRMGRALYETEPAFAAAFDACVAAMPDGLGLDQRRRMLSADPAELLPTSVMQPAVFVVEYALAMLWMSWGVTPSAMIGHSVGEFVAATLAGVFTLPDAMRLVCARGALMQSMPSGAMLSVKLPLAQLLELLPDDVSVAAENAPGSCVASGPHEAIERFRDQLHALGVSCRELNTSHAFHSSMMEPVVAPFRELVASVERKAPTIPIMSTARADWLDEQSACSPEYWSEHLRKPVRFSSALTRLLASPNPQVVLEVGPRTTLGTLARQHPELASTGGAAISSLGDAEDNEASSLRLAAGQAWSRGVAFEPSRLDRRTRKRRLLLPTYPFERQRHWVDAMPGAQADMRLAAAPVVAESRPTAPVGRETPVPGGAVSRRLGSLFSELRGLLSGRHGQESGAGPEHLSVISLPASHSGAARAPAVAADRATVAAAAPSPAESPVDGDLLDPRERLLAGFFREQVECQEIGRDDNFFQLGGDSLSAVQLMKRVEQSTGVRLNLLRLAKGTVGSLARDLPPVPGYGASASLARHLEEVRPADGVAGA